MMNKALFLVILFSALQGHATDCTPFSDQEFSPGTLINFVRQASYLKVEDVLCKLPVSFRSRYSIEFFSEVGAAQGASPENPRVHFFNDRFVLTFNGSSKQSGGDDIEIGFPNPHSALHDAKVVDFLLPGPHPQVRSSEQLGCNACHTSTETPSTGTRLLFNAAPFWEGFFGTSGFGGDDTMGDYYLKEKEAFEVFQKMAPYHSRYKSIIDLDKKFLSKKDYYASHASHTVKIVNGFDESETKVLSLINRQYAEALALINHERLVAIIMNTSHYNEYKFAIFAALSQCRNIDQYLPPEINALHNNEDFLYPELRGPVTSQMLEAVKLHFTVDSSLKGDPFGTGKEMQLKGFHGDNLSQTIDYILEEPTQIAKFYLDSKIRQEFYGAAYGYAKLRYLFEGRNPPISMREWSIDPKKGFYRFNNDKQVDDDEMLIPRKLRVADPELAALKVLIPFDRYGGDARHLLTKEEYEVGCNFLKKTSLERLSNKKVINILTRESKNRTSLTGFQVIQRECKTCHTLQVMHAPLFPIDNRQEFERRLTDYGGALGQGVCDRITRKEHQVGIMPKYGPLSENDKNSILSYLAGLGVKGACVK